MVVDVGVTSKDLFFLVFLFYGLIPNYFATVLGLFFIFGGDVTVFGIIDVVFNGSYKFLFFVTEVFEFFNYKVCFSMVLFRPV